ncbi:MAG: peptidoglycan-associated lipoprotein Pal [Sphingomonadales bacterium]|nr:peptidoglycan-associated lipoprotein Pal [Sphingomonadales bacterium]
MELRSLGFRALCVAAAALLISACANTGNTGGADPTPVEPVAETEPTETPAVETPEVTAVPLDAGPPAGSQESLVAAAGDLVFFEFDKSDLDSDARQTLQRQADWLRANAGVTVTVEGHCDERGTREYNIALGARRATAVKNYLVALGIDGDRISTISYGEERPAVPGSRESAWAQNRRGATVVDVLN